MVFTACRWLKAWPSYVYNSTYIVRVSIEKSKSKCGLDWHPKYSTIQAISMQWELRTPTNKFKCLQPSMQSKCSIPGNFRKVQKMRLELQERTRKVHLITRAFSRRFSDIFIIGRIVTGFVVPVVIILASYTFILLRTSRMSQQEFGANQFG